MLRRDRQIRMQMQQLLDAVLFALGFWLAYICRSDPNIIYLFSLAPVSNFRDYVSLYLILIPAAPLILEAQGFYSQPTLASRRTIYWPLFKGCMVTALTLILALFFLRMQIARSVIVWFGFVSFALVVLKEELFRIAFRSKLGQS